LDRHPHQLSGGERQRAALARAAVRGAGVWLLDEPFAPLDPGFRSDFRHDLHLLLEKSAATILLVTHDPIDALALGRRVGVLGDGRLKQLGTADELRRRPATRFVAAALGQLSFLDGRAVGRGGGDPPAMTFVAAGGLVEVPVPAPVARHLDGRPAHNLTLGFRPADVQLRPPGDCTGWPVVLAEPVGSGWVLTVARGSARVRVGWPSGSPPPVGDPVYWKLAPGTGVWFDADGRRIDDDDTNARG
jgi:multiple sugar transport system ATP-binding protein